MPKRVAITIAGAVSLGSYEAGVTYELLEAIRFHNEAIDEKESTKNDDEKIYVDVITGASAGGMTAAMLAQWLIFRGSAMKDVVSNPLYRAWVKRITLKGLVRLKKNEDKWHSLLSSDLIAEIGKEMLMDPMTEQPLTGPHPCLEPGAPLRVGIALTNMNGIDYMIPIEGSQKEGFNYTRSVDQRLFTVLPENPEGPLLVTPDGKSSPATWEDLRDVAVACGAFPFAFRPRQIQRNANEFVNDVTPLWPGKAALATAGTTYVTPRSPERWDFAYTDGGVLQNQPLGVAKDLVDASVEERLSVVREHKKVASDATEAQAADTVIGKVHRDADERLYVFISPNEVKSSADDCHADTISIAKMLPDIASVYFRQASFHDWIMAEGVNQNIKILDNRAKQLANVLGRDDGIPDVPDFARAAENLDNLLLREQKGTALERLRHQYNELYDTLAAVDPVKANAFLLGIAALEAAAHLDDRDKMHIYAVLADGKKELAGSGISSFVGFFSETFREHDYRVGRKKARAYLQSEDVSRLLGLDKKVLEKRYNDDPVPPINPPLALPLTMATTLKAGGRWIAYAVWIRTWKIAAVALGVLLIWYLWIARAHGWFPFVR